MKSAVVIKVNDFSLCDHFYRDVLQISQPEMLSSFGAVYKLSADFTLYLVKSDAKFLEHASAAVCWSFETQDMAALEKRLADAGFNLAKESFTIGCEEFRRGSDPEGNPFFVKESK
ncbi:MAG: hypothetical protein IKA87_08465 [Lentisphaeria bacterium]|nr:hypothetical protein [Lentisphaeria bacterium]